jgi:hypothetical protein
VTSPGGTSSSSLTGCRVCETEVPAGAFCGSCGAAQHGKRGRRRFGAYAATPSEHTLRPSLTTSLFPHLPQRSLWPFRTGFALLFLALIAFALLRWQAPLITVAALGLPMLFLLYLRESEVDDDLPRRSLLLTAAMGIVLGVGCAFVTGALVAGSYDVSLGTDDSDQQTILNSLSVLAIPILAAVLMLTPAVVMRFLRPGTRESLDGFVIGAWGAICFTAAATLTRLAPQLETGVTAWDRPVSVLLVEAGIQGVAMPVTSAALGGLVGVALWLGRRTLMASSVLVALGLYTLMGLMEVIAIPQAVHVGLHMLIAAFALIALRIGVQSALLHEEHDPIDPNALVLCPHCDTVVPDMPFCPNCGVAARAASRTSRAARRAAAVDEAATVHQTSNTRLLTALGVGAAVVAAAGVTAAVVATPAEARYVCPPDCGRPPIAEPIESNPRFVSADGAFSVQYPGPGTAYEATLNPDGVDLKFLGGDTGTLQLFGMPADGLTPKQIADDLIGEKYPDATTDYEIPNAMVGYEPGYGVVVDEYPQDASGSFTRLRLVVMVAVRNDYALVAAAIGPYHEFTRDDGPGHPSGVNLQLAMDMGKYVNSFRWNESTG